MRNNEIRPNHRTAGEEFSDIMVGGRFAGTLINHPFVIIIILVLGMCGLCIFAYLITKGLEKVQPA